MHKVIKNKAEYEAAMQRFHLLQSAADGTSEAEERELLALLISTYEAELRPKSLPDPIDAIKSVMEDRGLRNVDLAPCMGSPSRVTEVLSRKRPLTVEQIRKLSRFLHLPIEVLIQETVPKGYSVASEQKVSKVAEERRT